MRSLARLGKIRAKAGQKAAWLGTAIFALAILALIVSIVSAAISVMSLQEARASRQINQLANRPFLDVVSMKLVDPNVNVFLSFDIGIENLGRTPASNIVLFYRAQMDDETVCYFDSPPPLELAMIGPGRKLVLSGFSMIRDPKGSRPKSFARVQSGRAGLTVEGILQYSDNTDDSNRRTAFCFERLATADAKNTDFKPCSRWELPDFAANRHAPILFCE